MLYLGVILIILGIYSIFEDIFDVKTLLKEKKIVVKEKIKIDSFYKLKLVVACFAIILGVLSLINYFS